jgi:hypothetical protein
VDTRNVLKKSSGYFLEPHPDFFLLRYLDGTEDDAEFRSQSGDVMV